MAWHEDLPQPAGQPHRGAADGRVGGPKRARVHGRAMSKAWPTKEKCKHGHRLLDKSRRPVEANITWRKKRTWHTQEPRWYANCKRCEVTRRQARRAATK